MSELIDVNLWKVCVTEKAPCQETQKPAFLLAHGKVFNSEVWENINTLDSLVAAGHRAVAFDVPDRDFVRSRSVGEIGNRPSAFIASLLFQLRLSKTVGVFPSLSGPRLGFRALDTVPHEFSGAVMVAPVGTDRFEEGAKRWNVPGLVVWGDDDQVTPIENAELVAGQFTNAVVATVEGGAHACYMQNPKGFNELLTWFGADPATAIKRVDEIPPIPGVVVAAA